MKFVKKQSDKILIATRDEAFDVYVRNHPVISRLIREIGTDDKDILNTIYQVLENDGYKHSFDIVEKVLTVNIL